MSDVGRVLRLDARRTALFLAVPVLAIAGGLAAWHGLLPGVAYWDNAVAALFSSVGVLGPLSAGLSAWLALREHRLDYLRGLTARSPAVGPLLDLLLLGTVTVSAYVVVTAVVSVRTMWHAEAGRPQLMGIVAGGVTLVVYAIAGYLAGRVVPRLIVVPFVAVVTYLWAVVRHGGWAVLLPPPGTGNIGLFATLSAELLTYQALWSFGLGGLMVSGYVWGLTRHRYATLALVLTLALTIGMTLAIHHRRHAPLSANALSFACREWPLTVCVHPALRTALPSLEAALTPLATRLSGTPGAFTRVEQRPDRESPRPAHGTVYIHLNDLSPGYEHRAEQEIQQSLLDARRCTDQDHVDGARYSALVSAWLLDESPPEVADVRAAQSFTRRTEQQRRSWLRAHYGRFRSCALSAADLRAS